MELVREAAIVLCLTSAYWTGKGFVLNHRQDLSAFNTESLLPEVDNMACIYGHAPIKVCAETPAYILDPSDLVSGFTRVFKV